MSQSFKDAAEHSSEGFTALSHSSPKFSENIAPNIFQTVPVTCNSSFVPSSSSKKRQMDTDDTADDILGQSM